jgi:hypothetical protein
MDDAKAKFQSLSLSEKFAGVAAAGVALSYLISRAYQGGGIFPTCAIIGAAGVLILIGTSMAGMSLVDAAMRPKLLIGLSLLPLFGFVIDMLSNFWFGFLLASAMVMAYSAVLALGPRKQGGA